MWHGYISTPWPSSVTSYYEGILRHGENRHRASVVRGRLIYKKTPLYIMRNVTGSDAKSVGRSIRTPGIRHLWRTDQFGLLGHQQRQTLEIPGYSYTCTDNTSVLYTSSCLNVGRETKHSSQWEVPHQIVLGSTTSKLKIPRIPISFFCAVH